jgi:hypothetical protein
VRVAITDVDCLPLTSNLLTDIGHAGSRNLRSSQRFPHRKKLSDVSGMAAFRSSAKGFSRA